MESSKEIKLPDEVEKAFVKNIKTGILKELHQKKMLTDVQLDKLILMQK